MGVWGREKAQNEDRQPLMERRERCAQPVLLMKNGN